jgi:hypothetical protein
MLVDNNYFHCGDSWIVENCDSFHNDECPQCSSEIEPFKSTEYTEDGDKEHYHSTDSVYEVELAGHSCVSEGRDNLLLWIAASSEEKMREALKPFKNIVSDKVSKTDYKMDVAGVDISAEDSLNSIYACIRKKYEAVKGEDFQLNPPSESSHYKRAFTGRLEKVLLSDTGDFVLLILDSDNYWFHCSYVDAYFED